MAKVISEAAVRLSVTGSAAAENEARRAGAAAGAAFAAGFSRDASGRLRDERGRFVGEGRASGDAAGAAAGDGFEKRLRSMLSGLGPRLQRMLSGLGRGLLSQFDLRPLLAQAGRLATILGALSLAHLGGQVAAAGVIQLIAALSQLGGVVALIPAAYAAAGIAVGALATGLLGFGEALKSIADPKKFAEAIKGLAPAARDTAIALRDIKTTGFDPLQLEVQGVLFDGLAQRVQQLGKLLLPIMRSSFVAVASAANQAAHDIANVLVDPARLADITAVSAASAMSFRELAGAAGPLTNALIDLVAVGSDFFPGLVAGAGGLAQRFADFIATARESGALADFISAALSGFGDLFRIVGNLGSALAGVFSAANTGGGGLLQLLVDLTGELADLANSAAGSQALVSFFAGAGEAARALLPLVGGVLQVLGALGPTLTQVGLIVAPVLGDILNVLAQVATDLGPVVVEVFRTLAGAARQLLPAVAPTLGVFADALTALLPAVPPLVDAFVALSSVLAPLLPVAARLVAVIVAALAPALTTVATALTPVVEAFADQLEPIITELTPILRELAAVAGDVLAQSINEFLPLIAQMAPAMGDLAVVIGQSLLTVLTALQPVLPTLVQAFVQLMLAVLPLLPVIGQIIGLAAGLIAQLAPLVGAVAAVNVIFLRFVGVLVGAVAGALTGLISGVSRAASFVTDAFTSMGRGAGDALNSLLGLIRGLPGNILGALGALGGLLYQAGRNVIQGLIDGIKSMISSVASAASNVASTIKDHLPFSPAKRGPLREFPPERAGRAIVSLLAAGLRANEGALAAAVAAMLTGAGLTTVPSLGMVNVADVVASVAAAAPGAAASGNASSPATGVAGGDAADEPVVLHLVDVDGVLIGTMTGVIADHNREVKRSVGSRR